MARLATYISFPGNAREAFTYYQEVFGGELEITGYGNMDTSGFPFQPGPDAVGHASLLLPGGEIAGGDVVDDKDYPLQDTAYSMLYTLDDPESARTIIQRLVSDGGAQTMPFELAPWGSWYGQVFDKYGVMWAFSVEAG